MTSPPSNPNDPNQPGTPETPATRRNRQPRTTRQPGKPVFYDPDRKRWKRLRRLFDSLALAGAVVGILFVIGLLRMRPLQALDLRSATRRYRALSNPPALELSPREKLNHSLHRHSDLKPSDVVLNQGEGLRAAF